jgi:hypothetical protein
MSRMSVAGPDLWTLTRGRPEVDPEQLAAAVERQALQGELDFRTRLLIRDSVNALTRFWGAERVAAWLRTSPAARLIESVRAEIFPRPGFPTLGDRVMNATKPDDILQFLRELGVSIPRPVRVEVGGSAALILAGNLLRHTEDVDLVNEVPAELRNQHALLDSLRKRYGLHLAHFQSHYLPAGWDQRLQSLGPLGQLEVHLLDPYDIALGKMFSNREKDRDDLRVLVPQLNKAQFVARLNSDAAALVGEQRLRTAAEKNWYILFGETLPA